MRSKARWRSVLPATLPICPLSEEMTSRYWLFTLNNPEETHDVLSARFAAARQFRFLVFQEEEGQNGTRHFQGPLSHLPFLHRMVRCLTGQATSDLTTSETLDSSDVTTALLLIGNDDVDRMRKLSNTARNKTRALQDLTALATCLRMRTPGIATICDFSWTQYEEEVLRELVTSVRSCLSAILEVLNFFSP